MQEIQVSVLPFHLHRKTIQVSSGLNLQQMVDHVFPHNIPDVRVVVNIGDQVIPAEKWAMIKPKPHALVGINVVAAGGKKKNPLSIIISIALIVAAPYITAAIAPQAAAASAAVSAGIKGATITAGQMATLGAIRIGISMVGFLATSMLSSVPKQRANAASPNEASSQYIEGAGNKVDKYGVVPVNLGVNRMFPPQAGLPYTETTGNLQYVRQLFTYGFGKVQITERKIGETLITEYDGVELEDRLDANLDSTTQLYSRDVNQEPYSVLVSAAAGSIIRTTAADSDEAQIDLTFVSGLTEYNSSAQRLKRTVDFELKYRKTGTTTWSNGQLENPIASQSVTLTTPTAWETNSSNTGKRVAYGIIVLNLRSGLASVVSYTQGSSPIIPADSIRIASFRTENTSPTGFAGAATVASFTDERASHIPNKILNSTDFAFTAGSGLVRNIAAGTLVGQVWRITDATAQSRRVTQRIVFPEADQYDIFIQRITPDTTLDRIRDAATLTAIRSIRYEEPVTQPNISGTAMRILATDQLNGTVASYNCVVATLIKDYNSNLDTWVTDAISSNPASIYRYVLQSPAFIKALPDERINIEKLEEWHEFCRLKGLSYNRIIDSVISIDDLLNDIAAAGMATPHKINGVYSVLIDNERSTIRGMVTPRNSWGYNGSITYPELPHALRVQFRNKNALYATDERIVYSDGYDASNASLYERLQFDSCTDADLAFFYGRTYLATAISQPEIHSFNQDFENLTYSRGDKIIFVNDIILVGVGQGRIRELIYDDPDSPTEVLGFILDEEVDIPKIANFGVRIRYGDASGFFYHSLETQVGVTDQLTFSTPIPIEDAPPLDSLCAFTEFGKELELVVTEITMNRDHSAKITAVNYAPERFNAINGPIPSFESNITLTSDFYRPAAPTQDGNIQSDESVMSRNSDGSYVTRMIIPLKNTNETSVNIVTRYRPTGATEWDRPNILSSTPEQLILTGLQDGTNYDFSIAYQRQGGLQLMSPPLIINNVKFIGAGTRPAQVTGFTLSITEGIANFKWNPNADIDISHYKIKFAKTFSGATWATAQLLEDNIDATRLTTTFQSGTYLIKAVDILGNESETETLIITYEEDAFRNVVDVLDQEPGFPGYKDNASVQGSTLVMGLLDQDAYYYFDRTVDFGETFTAFGSAAVIANGAYVNNIFDESDIFAMDDVFGQLGGDFMSTPNVFDLDDVFGIGAGTWAVQLQYRTTLSAPFNELTNYLTASQDFSTGWTFLGCTATANAGIAPDGSNDAVFLQEDATTGQRRFYTGYMTIPSGTTASLEVFVKPVNGRNGVMLHGYTPSSAGEYYIEVDLTDNSVDNIFVDGGAVGSCVVENAENGFIRIAIEIEFAAPVTEVAWSGYFSTTGGNGNASYTGDTVSGIYVWHPRLTVESIYQPTWGDWEEFAAGNKTYRAIQFRLLMQSFAPSVSPLVSKLSVTIDMPDRVEAGNDIVIPVTGLRIDFIPHFRQLNGCSPQSQDLSPGDVLSITNKDETGFDVIAYNDVGGPVERTLDYVAKGYGRKLS